MKILLLHQNFVSQITILKAPSLINNLLSPRYLVNYRGIVQAKIVLVVFQDIIEGPENVGSAFSSCIPFASLPSSAKDTCY